MGNNPDSNAPRSHAVRELLADPTTRERVKQIIETYVLGSADPDLIAQDLFLVHMAAKAEAKQWRAQLVDNIESSGPGPIEGD